MHLASMLKEAGGSPSHGNFRKARDEGARFDHPVHVRLTLGAR
jgi:hypothetical protein